MHIGRAHTYDPDSPLTIDLSQSDERRYFRVLNSPVDDVANELGRQFIETHILLANAFVLRQVFFFFFFLARYFDVELNYSRIDKIENSDEETWRFLK